MGRGGDRESYINKQILGCERRHEGCLPRPRVLASRPGEGGPRARSFQRVYKVGSDGLSGVVQDPPQRVPGQTADPGATRSSRLRHHATSRPNFWPVFLENVTYCPENRCASVNRCIRAVEIAGGLLDGKRGARCRTVDEDQFQVSTGGRVKCLSRPVMPEDTEGSPRSAIPLPRAKPQHPLPLHLSLRRPAR